MSNDVTDKVKHSKSIVVKSLKSWFAYTLYHFKGTFVLFTNNVVIFDERELIYFNRCIYLHKRVTSLHFALYRIQCIIIFINLILFTFLYRHTIDPISYRILNIKLCAALFSSTLGRFLCISRTNLPFALF